METKKNLVILGPQGSGKGTQAKILVEKLRLYYFDMGSFLRNLAKKDEKIRQMQAEGVLIPDDLFFFAMKALLQGKIATGQGMILDGFPRTINQYQVLKNWFSENNLKIDTIIFLAISDEEAIRRLSARRTCQKCGQIYNLTTSPKPKVETICDGCGGFLEQRTDDEPQAIQKRLTAFRNQTLPVLDLAQKDGVLLKINGEQPIPKVTQDIIKALKM